MIIQYISKKLTEPIYKITWKDAAKACALFDCRLYVMLNNRRKYIKIMKNKLSLNIVCNKLAKILY